MIRSVFIGLLLLAVCAPCAFSQRTILKEDGLRNIVPYFHFKPIEPRDIEEVTRIPLFDNAPFLRLREGDKLVKVVIHPSSREIGKPDSVGYFLQSGGEYYLLQWVDKEDHGKLLLSKPYYSLMFDWDFTMENANALRMLSGYSTANNINEGPYNAIIAAIDKAYPKRGLADIPRCLGRPDRRPDKIVSIPGQTYALFTGVAYDFDEDSIVQYWVKIGPHVFTVIEQILIQGPESVDVGETELQDDSAGRIGPPEPPDPREIEYVKIKKAQYEKMLKFEKLIYAVIHPDFKFRE